MTAAVLYARYSSELQNVASLEDQLRLLRQRAAREGWTIAAEHSDRAISGTVRDRPGLIASLAAIEAGTATVLLAEGLDRISRDQEDIASFFKRIRFAGARIVTLSEGDIGALHIGMGGTISAIYLEQLADKTRRGQIGRVAAGRIPGGLSYGYRAVRQLGADGEPERGLREIIPEQAAVIRRIFAQFADGSSPRAIALALNAEQIPGPRGGPWRANAISGHRARGNGVLHNQLYRGMIVYNRQTFRKDPETRRRVARATAEGAQVTQHVPALCIVDDDLWQRAQARLEQFADRPAHAQRRHKRLLSGLLRCGCCGGAYISVTPKYWGCSNHRQTGSCVNGRNLADADVQRRLWRALEDDLLDPEVVAEYLETFRRGLVDARRRRMAQRGQTDRRLAEIAREESNLIAAIAAGVALEGIKSRIDELAAERAALVPESEDPILARLDAAAAHPALAESYRRHVAQLHIYAEASEAERQGARRLLDALVDHIEVTPNAEGKGSALTVHGKLAALLALGTENEAAATSDCLIELVAGVGLSRCHTIRIAA